MMQIKASDNSANVYLLSFLIVVGLGTLLIGYDASVNFGAEAIPAELFIMLVCFFPEKVIR